MSEIKINCRLPMRAGSVLLSGVAFATFGGVAEAQITPQNQNAVCGDATVDVTADVHGSNWGVREEACGSMTVNVSEGTSVTNLNSRYPTLLAWAGTNVAVNINGDVLANSADGIGLDVYGSVVDARIGASGTLIGTYYGSSGDETFSIAAGGNWSTAGMNTFWTGEDTIINSGTVEALGGAIFEGVEHLSNSGLFVLGQGTVEFQGDVEFINSGSVRVWNGQTLLSIGQITNGGQLDLSDGLADDTLRITGGYAGVGNAAVALDVSATSSDRLVIEGPVTGSTVVNVNVVGSSQIIRNGVLAVEANGNQVGLFVLGQVAGNTSSLLRYRLSENGGGFFLFATPSAASLRPVVIGRAAQDMWHQSSDPYLTYAVLRRTDLRAGRKGRLGHWVQFYEGNDRSGDDHDSQSVFGADVDINSRIEAHRRGVQGGIDSMVSDNLVVGITGGHERSKVRGSFQSSGVVLGGFNLGVYLQFASSSGFYGGLLVKKDWNDVRLIDGLFDSADRKPSAKVTGIDVEGGYRQNALGITFDFGAGLGYVRDTVQDMEVEGITYDFDGGSSLRGRLGIRAEFSSRYGTFVAARILHEFDGDNKLTLTSGAENDTVSTDGRGTWVRLEAGIGCRMKAGPMVSAWLNAGHVNGVGLKAGLRF